MAYANVADNGSLRFSAGCYTKYLADVLCGSAGYLSENECQCQTDNCNVGPGECIGDSSGGVCEGATVLDPCANEVGTIAVASGVTCACGGYIIYMQDSVRRVEPIFLCI